MNIDRPMAALFFEIKREAPFEERADMKISSPDVGQRLVALYRDSNDKALKKMIKTFMEHAGDDWAKQLAEPEKKKFMFYRT